VQALLESLLIEIPSEILLEKPRSVCTPTLDLGVRVCIVRREMGLCPLALTSSLVCAGGPTHLGVSQTQADGWSRRFPSYSSLLTKAEGLHVSRSISVPTGEARICSMKVARKDRNKIKWDARAPLRNKSSCRIRITTAIGW